MIEEEISKDVSLLRCTLKKSQQVFAKVVLLVSYAIVVLSLLGCGYLLVTGILIPGVAPIVAAIVVGVLMIPWYYYAGSVIILAIPVYSFLWCIARELTDEDWNSREAENIAAAFAAAATIAAVAAALVVAAAATIAVAALVAAAGVVAALVVAAADTNNKLMRFPGAYLHYRRRIKHD